jgi:hypothetical protein
VKLLIFAKAKLNRKMPDTQMKGLLFQTTCRKAITVFLLTVCLIGKGQEATEGDFGSDPAFIGTVLTEKSDPNTLITPEIKKVSFSFSTGMMLGISGYKNNFTASYIAPAVAYNVSPRLRVRAGGLIFFNSFCNPVAASPQSGESSAGFRDNLALFVAADYFVTDRLTLSGSYYKLPENFLFRQRVAPEVYNRYNTYYNIPSESMSLGLNYEITKGFYVGAEFRFSNHYQPCLNPYPLMPGITSYDPLYW